MKILLASLILTVGAFAYDMPPCPGKVSLDKNVCQAIQRTANKLNSRQWSPKIEKELKRLWRFEDVSIYTSEVVFLSALNQPPYVVAVMRHTWWREDDKRTYYYSINIKESVINDKAIDTIILHELYHVADMRYLYAKGQSVTDYELELRAHVFLLYYQKEFPKAERTYLRGMVQWDDDWTGEEWRDPVKKFLKKAYRFDGEGMYDLRVTETKFNDGDY